jgi:class 3 adenylate cyclase
VQKNISEHRNENPHQPLQVRIGVASGEPIESHSDLFGSTVQLAARLCAHAAPEQILVSNTVAELCMGKAFPLKDIGRVELKGFDQPVHAQCIEPGKFGEG